MSYQAASTPLSRRLVERYLMFGLAGLFVCITLTIILANRGQLTELIPITALVPLILLMIGAVVLRRTVRLNEAIEQQLVRMASVPSITGAPLQPLADSEPTAVGWNTLLKYMADERTAATLESRLNNSLSSATARRWTAVFNTLSDGIAVCDRHGVVTQANNLFAVLLGKPSAENLSGQKLLDLMAGAIENIPPGVLEGLLHNAGTFSSELRKGADTATGVWRISRRPLLEDASDGSGALWIIRDVTQQKLAEEMRNQFVLTATHELRTPLTNIKAYAETLACEKEIDPQQQKGFYNIINAEATRLARFIDELLNVSQLEAGAVTIRKHETDIERLLGEVVEHVQPEVKKKQLQFESRLPPKILKLHVDKDKVVAALVNLLGNAVKYTPEGGTVRLLVEVEDTQIHFHVEDTGIGIAAEELPRICEKFFRSADSRVRKITGSGLGLAFSQEVARLHGGRIAIKSELNKGSRFTLSLPLE